MTKAYSRGGGRSDGGAETLVVARSLTSAARKDHDWNSEDDEFAVLPQRLMLEIGYVHLYHLLKGDDTASIDLPGAGQSRFAGKPQPVARVVPFGLVG